MKYLQRLFILFLISAVVFSCQKEYSVENGGGNNSGSGQWSFTEGSAQFRGPVDSVNIIAFGGYSVLTLNGRSTDSKDQIVLQIADVALKTGVYNATTSIFTYLRNNAVIYQSDRTDSFSIVVTKLDSTGITGTFSGKAYDSANTGRSIVDGKFSGLFKTSSTVTPVTDSGSVLLWSRSGCGGSANPISVRVGGVNGQITKFLTAEPTSCDSSNGFSVKLPVGTYPITALCGTDSVNSTVTVLKNGCTAVEVDLSGIPSLSGDYFPTTLQSNWSYMKENGSSGDTLYTESNSSVSIGGNAYSLFITDDGSNSDSLYYRKASHKYYQYLPAYLDSTNTGYDAPIEYVFLIDNAAAGSTFANGPYSAKYQGVPVSGGINGTILEVSPTAMVGTKTFLNVIKVRLSFVALVLGQTQELYRVEQWYSKGTGLIRTITYKTTPFTTADSIMDIGRYQVNP